MAKMQPKSVSAGKTIRQNIGMGCFRRRDSATRILPPMAMLPRHTTTLSPPVSVYPISDVCTVFINSVPNRFVFSQPGRNDMEVLLAA